MERRPSWPYVLGAIGAVVFAIGAILMLYVAGGDKRPSESTVSELVWMTSIGGFVLGVAWIGVFRQKQCGVGPIGGSFAVPLAFLYLYVNRGEWIVFDAGAMMVQLAFALFALGYLFVSSWWVRGLAAVAAIGLWGEIVVISGHMNVSASTHQQLGELGASGLAGASLVTIGTLLRLYQAKPDDVPAL